MDTIFQESGGRIVKRFHRVQPYPEGREKGIPIVLCEIQESRLKGIRHAYEY